MRLATAVSIVLMGGLWAGQAGAAGDPAKGERVFRKCMACHNVKSDENKVGPTLAGVFGRTAGAIEDFRYSSAMTEKGEEGLIWTDETMDEYLLDPRDYVEGTKMIFVGLRSEEDRADLIAYIKQFSETQ